ncbi:hypothetical protein [Planktotalea arctica]|uniref:hypothetical protein n=1 Tax=Planktotalea arctica TaxID=1481893 RepID=UPI0032193B3E
MNFRGPALIVAGLACGLFPALQYVQEDKAETAALAAPAQIQSETAQKQKCEAESVRIGKVWVGCHAQNLHKDKTRKLGFQRTTHRSGATFIKTVKN